MLLMKGVDYLQKVLLKSHMISYFWFQVEYILHQSEPNTLSKLWSKILKQSYVSGGKTSKIDELILK